MNRNSTRQDWFSPIDESPVLATVTHNGVVRGVRVPHKNALVLTGDDGANAIHITSISDSDD